MAMAEKNLRLIFPDWQHGSNPSSGMVPRLLAMIAPQGANSETVEVREDDRSVEKNYNETMAARATSLLPEEDFSAIYDAAARVLEEKQPTRIVSFATDGAAALAPIDYLHGKYEDLGVLWLDVHRESVTPARFWAKRTLIFGSVTRSPECKISGLVKNPLDPSRFIFASTRAIEIPPSQKIQIENESVHIAGPEILENDCNDVLDWLKREGITHLAVHLDMDSLGSADIRSGIYREEVTLKTPTADFSHLRNLKDLLQRLEGKVDLVGFGVMEYQLLDAPEFKELISSLSIFKR